MKYFLLLLITNLTFCSVRAQHVNQSQIDAYCGDKEHCGPYNMLDSVQKIIGEQTQAAPYKQILHIETKRNYIVTKKIDWGTVSFISPNTLITARHVVADKKFLAEIALSVANSGKDAWITFSKKEFEIKYYDGNEADVAVIRILNTEKLKQLYKGATFALGKLDTMSMKNEVFNLTGYPCYFANDPAGYDTLINKSVPAAKLMSNNNHIGYRIFTCVGDSGAPLWVNQGGVYTIVGIHHGGKENESFPEDYNMSARLDDELIAWLNAISK